MNADGTPIHAPVTISAVIPAYNQGRFVGAAVESALGQSPPPLEVIVVDDGSTDETADVLALFGRRIVCVDQPNRGVAAARNAGIEVARGSHVALLDADDAWTWRFMPEMCSLIERYPSATAYFGVAQLTNVDGAQMPQRAGPHEVSADAMLDRVLRSNFLIPSTMVLNREQIVAIGGFRSGFSGVEDKDLWIRLLQAGAEFVGTEEVVTRYRIHDDSLSASPRSMCESDYALVADLFGAADGDPTTWSRAKALAWAGHFRYVAVSNFTRGGEAHRVAAALRRALIIAPSLAVDETVFYELALGPQPIGWRGSSFRIDVDANADALEGLLFLVFDGANSESLQVLRPATYRSAYTALAKVAWNVGEPTLSRSYLRIARRHDASGATRRDWWRSYIRTFAPRSVVEAWRKRRLVAPPAH